ncbi:MAG: NUDIX hydrolase [Acidobacteria bacterium]|nr:NUDIX hydrolase [Acidobacteriota bacterium]
MVLDADDPSLGTRTDPASARAAIVDARLAPECEPSRRQVLELLDEHGSSLADRTCVPGHLTGSALVVEEGCGEVLVLFHRKLQRWLQPGGHADGDTNLANVALREATEETGIDGLRVVTPAIDLDVHAVDHGDPLGRHLHLDLRFLVLAPAGSRPVGNHESEALRWVDPADLAGLVDEVGILRLAAAARPALERLDRGPAAGS